MKFTAKAFDRQISFNDQFGTRGGVSRELTVRVTPISEDRTAYGNVQAVITDSEGNTTATWGLLEAYSGTFAEAIDTANANLSDGKTAFDARADWIHGGVFHFRQIKVLAG